MRTRSHFATISIVAAILTSVACSSTSPPSSSYSKPQPLLVTHPVASLSHESGHNFFFFASSDGVASVVELGPTGTPRILDGDTFHDKTVSEIYSLLSGGANPPESLLKSARRNETDTAIAVSPPPQADAEAGKGPQFYTAGEQQWFTANFCNFTSECINGYDYVTSSYGHHSGRGFRAVGMNGSEAPGSKYLEVDYWDGSSWILLDNFEIKPGQTATAIGGNVGDCSGGDTRTWYFKSEVDGGGSNSTVSLSSHVYAACGLPQYCCIDTGCPSGCDGKNHCPARGVANYIFNAYCAACDDSRTSCTAPP